MKNYHDLLAHVMDNGADQFNTRTKKTCRAVVGYQLQYDMADGFPAVTTKKLAFKSVIGELVGFFRGYDNAADFRAVGCNVWDKNANETQAWLDNPNRKGEDDLGRVYGKQWTEWRDTRIIAHHEIKRYKALGYELHQMAYTNMADAANQTSQWVATRTINQLENALRTLITNPSDRRIIVSGWNPAEFDLMALPPCHMDYRFVAFEDPRVLHVVMTIRSWDLFLGAPFNIASTSAFLAVMARLSGFEPGTVTIQATDAHIYDNHFEQVREQLSRDHTDQPQLVIADHIQPVSLDEIPGVFTRINPEDFHLEGYAPHPAIKADMAA